MYWPQFYLGMAEYVSRKSRDPSTKVGCVIVRPDNTVASLGFNGFPRGMDDDPALYNDREQKMSRVLHAEENAVLNAREPIHGYKAYLTHPPCCHCACVLIQAGIKSVHWIKPTPEMMERWGDQFEKTYGFFSEAKVGMVEYAG